MIIKIERKEKKEKPKKSKKPSKQRKVPMIKVGTHKKLTFVLWVLLIGSVGFGIYKNFTAIDTHTVRETEIIKQQIVDTKDKDKETISSSFHVVVHIDESDNMVIIKNPTTNPNS